MRLNRSHSALVRSVALVCLATMLAFAGLEALHRHQLTRSGAELQPCRICQIAASTLAAATPVHLLLPQAATWGEVPAPAGLRARGSKPLANFIRPPPERSALL